MYHQLEVNKANDWKMHRYACHLADPESYPLNSNTNNNLGSDLIGENKNSHMDDFSKAQSKYMNDLIALEKAKKKESCTE